MWRRAFSPVVLHFGFEEALQGPAGGTQGCVHESVSFTVLLIGTRTAEDVPAIRGFRRQHIALFRQQRQRLAYALFRLIVALTHQPPLHDTFQGVRCVGMRFEVLPYRDGDPIDFVVVIDAQPTVLLRDTGEQSTGDANQ